MPERCLSWSDDDDTWSDTLFTWSDCLLIDEALPGDGANIGANPQDYNVPGWVKNAESELKNNEKKKKRRLIQLITYVKDNKIADEKEVKDIKINVNDIMLVKNEMKKKMSVNINKM